MNGESRAACAPRKSPKCLKGGSVLSLRDPIAPMWIQKAFSCVWFHQTNGEKSRQRDQTGEVRLRAAQPGDAGRRREQQVQEDARQEQQAVQLGLRRQPGQDARTVPPVRPVRQRPVDDVQRRRPERELHRVVRHDDRAGGEQGNQIGKYDGP